MSNNRIQNHRSYSSHLNWATLYSNRSTLRYWGKLKKICAHFTNKINHLHLQMHVVKLAHHTPYMIQVQLIIIVSIYELIKERTEFLEVGECSFVRVLRLDLASFHCNILHLVVDISQITYTIWESSTNYLQNTSLKFAMNNGGDQSAPKDVLMIKLIGFVKICSSTTYVPR